MKLLHSGKVRDVYLDGDDLILVASDRLSIYDVVLPTPIPDKGAVLTQLSLWWFDRLADLVPHHVISGDRRARRVRRARGPLPAAGRCCPSSASPAATSPGWGSRSTRSRARCPVCALPAGLVEGSKLPEPIFTPTTKAPVGEHDEFMTFDEVVGRRRCRDRGAAAGADPRRLHARGARPPRPAGSSSPTRSSSSALGADGEIVLADEVLTPDSSRFWPADSLGAGPRRSSRSTSSSCASGRPGPGLGPHPARPGDPCRRRGRHPGPLRRGLRADHRARPDDGRPTHHPPLTDWSTAVHTGMRP